VHKGLGLIFEEASQMKFLETLSISVKSLFEDANASHILWSQAIDASQSIHTLHVEGAASLLEQGVAHLGRAAKKLSKLSVSCIYGDRIWKHNFFNELCSDNKSLEVLRLHFSCHVGQSMRRLMLCLTQFHN
jgi:hypothetical protein